MTPQRSHDSTGGRFPSDSTLELLERSITGYVAGESGEEVVCDALAILANEARGRHLQAEQMLLAFKSIWSNTPAVKAMRDASAKRVMLDHVIHLCIDAYFKP